MKIILLAAFATTMLVGLPTAPAFAQSFNGYPCTQDCSGHQAGYEWAQRKGITSAAGCGGNSNSFIEGCRSLFEEEDDSDSYGNDDDSEEGLW